MNRNCFLVLALLFAQPVFAADWNVSGLFDSFTSSAGGGGSTPSNILAPVKTTYTSPSFNPNAQMNRVYKTQPTASGGMPVCPNRNAASQQSASGYQLQPVSKGY